MIPEDLRYTAEHEWLAATDSTATDSTATGSAGTDSPDAATAYRVGITHFAQDALGDIVYVALPEVGTEVEARQPLGEVESTKSVSEIYAPLSGTVVARNDRLSETPELINTDPYGAGWLIEIRPSDPSTADGLLDAAAYRDLTEAA